MRVHAANTALLCSLVCEQMSGLTIKQQCCLLKLGDFFDCPETGPWPTGTWHDLEELQSDCLSNDPLLMHDCKALSTVRFSVDPQCDSANNPHQNAAQFVCTQGLLAQPPCKVSCRGSRGSAADNATNGNNDQNLRQSQACNSESNLEHGCASRQRILAATLHGESRSAGCHAQHPHPCLMPQDSGQSA